MKEVNAIPPHLREGWTQDVQPKNVMGKNEFLKLLVTQLQSQDPLNPMEHNEFTAQLAQFSTLEQLSNIDTSVQKLHPGIEEEAKMQALGMIGKDVEATGDTFELEKGKSLTLKHTLDKESKPVRAAILSVEGKQVRALDLAQLPAGADIVWDGKDDAGESAPSGKYTFRVLGVDKNGKAVEVGAEISGRVTGVEMNGKNPQLIVESERGPRTISLGSVKRVTIKAADSGVKAPANLTAKLDPASKESASINNSIRGSESPFEEVGSLRGMGMDHSWGRER